jgi:hypothetical protein
MAQWLVMQGNTKFPVEGLAELETLARRGSLKSGDMIQPPGTTDWLYVTDVPELRQILERNATHDDDDEGRAPMFSGTALAAGAGLLGLGLLGVIVVGGGIMLYFAGQMRGSGGRLIGDGGLAFSEMIVTSEGSGLRAEPADAARITTSVDKDSTLELMSKRGSFYRARTSGGAEGWIPTTHVIPMYQLGGIDVRQEYDPLYNPDRYVEVGNARWMQLPAEKPGPMQLTNVTAFEFMISNESSYAMTDLKIQATIKDAQGHELEKVEIPVEGILPADGDSFVGTLSAEVEGGRGKGKGKARAGDPPIAPDRVMTTWSFEQMAADDPDLQLRWTSGVEVEMKTATFTSAEIDVIELRAVPDEEAAAVVRRD